MKARKHCAPDALGATGATSREMAPARVSGRRWAAGLLRGTLDMLVSLGHREATQRRVAGVLGISPAHMQRLCGDGDPAIALGDVRAMGDELARAIFSAALADCTPPATGASACPQAITLVALEHVGTLAATAKRVLADGRVTRGEWGEVDAALAALEAAVCQARSAVRAAMRGGAR